MNSSVILGVTTVIMFVGGLLILFTGKRRTASEELHTVCHGIVPIIAACSYFAMAIGQGAVLLPTDTAVVAGTGATRIFYYARYVDWSFTTPLLLLTLSMTAMHAGPKRTGAITGIILADVMMIVTAFAFGASTVAFAKWAWFVISCIAFVGVYYVLWISHMQANAAERDDVRSTYRRNASVLSALWLLYPVVLAFAPDGLNMMSDGLSVLCIAVLDVVAKVVYGLSAVKADTKATDLDLAEGGTTRPFVRAAA